MSLVATVVACGGGGGSGDSDPVVPPPPPAPGVTAPQVQGLNCSGVAQSGWCWQEPQPAGSRTNKAFFLDAQHGWVVGDAGLIARTEDSGQTWAVQRSGVEVSLDKVSFADAQRGWVFSSSDGVALYTSDGGQHWARAGALTLAGAIRDAWVLADGTAIVTDGDTTLRSEAAGASWQAAALQVRHVTPRGTLLGTQGTVWGRSTDQGRSFTVQTSVAGGRPLTWVAGDGKTTLWALVGRPLFVVPGEFPYPGAPYGSDPQTIYRSDDDGATWTAPVEIDEQMHIQKFVLEVDGTGWAQYQGRPGRPVPFIATYFRRTTDGGRTWSTARAGEPFNVDLEILYLGDAGLIDGQTMWVRNSVYMFLTADGGQSWRRFGSPSNQPPYEYTLDATRFERDRSGALVMQVNQTGLQRSVDQGQTWARLLGPRTDDTIDGLWFFDAQRGLALGLNGTLFDTTDGGLHWLMRDTPVGPDGSAPFNPTRQLQFSSATVGWMVAGGKLLRSSDAGRTWAQATTPAAGGEVVWQVQFLSAQVGWVTTRLYSYVPPGLVDPTRLHFTFDGGNTWETRPTAFDGRSQLTFASANIGLRSVDGAGFRTTDGGRTWLPIVTAAGPVRLGNVYFADADNAWALTTPLQRSSDGGQTWRVVNTPALPNQPPNIAAHWTNIRFIDRQRGWIVGSGSVLATTDGGDTWVLQSTGTQEWLGAIFARDADNVWVGGTRGAILATGNGGRSF